MPLPGAKYRVTTTKSGKQVRLAFKGGKVVEAKNLATGATHTPAEFARDRAQAAGKTAKAHRPTFGSHLSALRGAGAFSRSA